MKTKILVVEDEPDISKVICFSLKQEGYDVIAAFDGQDGFDKYQKEKPALIVLDISLPRMTGTEVCRQIRRECHDRTTRILMLTAKTEDADRIVGRVVGADAYLGKPFAHGHLLDEIKRLLAEPGSTSAQ